MSKEQKIRDAFKRYQQVLVNQGSEIAGTANVFSFRAGYLYLLSELELVGFEAGKSPYLDPVYRLPEGVEK